MESPPGRLICSATYPSTVQTLFCSEKVRTGLPPSVNGVAMTREKKLPFILLTHINSQEKILMIVHTVCTG